MFESFNERVGANEMGEEVDIDKTQRVLLTGASGYIGGRLREKLEELGASVRCLARRPECIRNRLGEKTEVLQGDVLERATLDVALKGIDTAYYMVHSMGGEGPEGFSERDRIGAENFSLAARESGVKRIIYLGALGVEGDEL